jgi:ubiquitin-activating enzyme E1
LRIKIIAGKIIPAIATSTALVVGVSGMELIKHTMGVKVENRRNSWVNLALPNALFSEPMPPLWVTSMEYDPIMMGPVKAIPDKFSTWDM